MPTELLRTGTWGYEGASTAETRVGVHACLNQQCCLPWQRGRGLISSTSFLPPSTVQCMWDGVLVRKMNHFVENKLKYKFFDTKNSCHRLDWLIFVSGGYLCLHEYFIESNNFSQFSSVAQPQHARPPCPSPAPRVYPNSCPLSWWCHPTISSSVVPFSSCPQSFPASGSFQMSQLFTSGGQSIGVSASTSVLPMNTQDWSPLGWTGWISLQSKGLSRVFSNTTVQKHQFFGTQLSL